MTTATMISAGLKLAVVGKGGSGKTTTAAAVARGLARRGRDVGARDCATHPNLGISLGLGEDATDDLVALRDQLDAGEGEHAATMTALLQRYGAEGPDGVHLAVVNRIAEPSPSCPCCGLSPEQLLASPELSERDVVADLEAGIGTLTRLGDDVHLDAVLVIVEPNPKSLEVGRRAASLADEIGAGRVLVVANRIRGEEDRAAVADALGERRTIEVPDDPAVLAADRAGVAPLDRDPDSPAALVWSDLVEQLLAG